MEILVILIDYPHLGEFRRGTAGDLLHTQLAELGLELIELLLEVVLGLGPELAGAELVRRLQVDRSVGVAQRGDDLIRIASYHREVCRGWLSMRGGEEIVVEICRRRERGRGSKIRDRQSGRREALAR